MGGAVMKYDRMEKNAYDAEANNTVASLLEPNEKVLWQGKPRKYVYILENVLTMLPFAIVWLLFDGLFIAAFAVNYDKIPWFTWLFIVPFFILHLFPVWVWFAKVISANRRYKNTEYCVTEKRVIIKSGFVGMQLHSLMMKDIVRVDIHRGLFDKMFGVGDLSVYTASSEYAKNSLINSIIDIPDYIEVMKLIQKVAYDVKADVSFPNALRPAENPGYNTEYKPVEVLASVTSESFGSTKATGSAVVSDSPDNGNSQKQ